ncbi:hypothetical protein NUW58_g7901 [Xylaria curta]|uniref:Uncharacterized protein n=1 Tax=Xylaria curta TaxID=42375 RepID=A0ACC1NCU8_9PEZI|nr:hypothetical protein NUW58_g7901 [Xylaria curta]
MDTSYTPTELSHLRRTIALAAEALEAGDSPFGSVLVDGKNPSSVLHEDRNRTKTMDDATRHPEFEIARWAAAHMTPEDRRAATVFTSGEHCPMCSAAHAWVGLGRIVYVASAEQLCAWMEEFARGRGVLGEAKLPVALMPIRQVAPGLEVAGPVPELEGEIKDLHRRHAG